MYACACVCTIARALHYACEFCIVFALLPVQCAVFGLLPAQCVVCVNPVLCLHYCHTVCCACKSCVMFALLPAQCVVCVSPVSCLHYCQHSMLYGVPFVPKLNDYNILIINQM